MSKMKLVLDVANNLRNVADSIETLVGAMEVNEAADEPVKETKKKAASRKEAAQVEETPPEEKQPTLEEVRAKLAALSQDGKQAEVKALITAFGAKKLSDIPADKYQALLEKASEL